jgi:G:T/U-mismatch repair DNA glycosylase
MKVLFVGINPSSAKLPSQNTTKRRMPKWSDALGLKYHSFVNCIGKPGPYKAKDVEYDLLAGCLEGYTRVVALGKFPSKVLDNLGVDHFVLPHPSGLNRKLNDREYELQQLEECRKYIHG